MQNERERFYDLLKDLRTVTLITRVTASGGGEVPGSDLGIRPMTIAKIDTDCNLWILTDADSDVAREVATDSRVSVLAQHEQESFLVLSGVGQVLQDPQTVRSLWKEPYKVWFPGGPDDPAIRLIYVDSKSGEYWDTQGLNKVKYLFAAAKAYVTGDRPETEEGEQHGTVRFS